MRRRISFCGKKRGTSSAGSPDRIQFYYSFLYFLCAPGVLSCLYVNAFRHLTPHLTRRIKSIVLNNQLPFGVWLQLMSVLINSVFRPGFILTAFRLILSVLYCQFPKEGLISSFALTPMCICVKYAHLRKWMFFLAAGCRLFRSFQLTGKKFCVQRSDLLSAYSRYPARSLCRAPDVFLFCRLPVLRPAVPISGW